MNTTINSSLKKRSDNNLSIIKTFVIPSLPL